MTEAQCLLALLTRRKWQRPVHPMIEPLRLILKKPFVVAAAIRGKDGKIYSLPAPARHPDIGRHMIELGHPKPFPGGKAQGFIMSDGSFASREIAKECAKHHGQLLPRASNSRELFSEDVW